MSIKYDNTSYIVRCNKNIRLYESTKSVKPSTKVMCADSMFVSNKNATLSNGVTLYLITKEITCGSDVVGYWIDSNVCDVTKNETQVENTANGNMEVYLSITGSKSVIYATKDSITPIICSLTVGDIVKCDDKISITNNGIDEIRYHMISINNKTEDDLCGMWILNNYSITDNSKKYEMSENKIVEKPKDHYFAPKAKQVKAETTFTVNDPTRQSGAPNTRSLNVSSDGTVASYALTDDALISAAEQTAKNNVMDADDAALYEKYGIRYLYASSYNSVMSIPIGRLTFVHGMPFQYNAYTDRRNYSTLPYGASPEALEGPITEGEADMYGRVFAKEILANTPIVTIVPGEPQFLTKIKTGIFATLDTSSSKRDSWVPLFTNIDEDDIQSAFNDIIKDGESDYNYYSLTVNTERYYLYVNSLCRVSAKLMGLSKRKYRGVKCTSIDWGKYNSSADQDYNMFMEVTGLDGGVSFAYDPQSSVSDTISNSTGDSALSSLLNQASSKIKELQFIAGSAKASEVANLSNEDYESAVENYSGSGLGSRLSALFHNTVAGNNIRFPEIWQDSNMSKAYSLDMKFVTPYSNSFCQWRYVLVPFFHIFTLAAPRSETTINAYKSPFLIRAFSKGYFNVELGIIESITWKRFGDGDMIGENGVPNEIDVSIDFKDMYHSLSMATWGDKPSAKMISLFFNNTGLMDLVGTLSGVNMNRIGLSERLSLYAMAEASIFGTMGSNIIRSISDRVRNITEKYFYGT